jgi:hypothetical protein
MDWNTCDPLCARCDRYYEASFPLLRTHDFIVIRRSTSLPSNVVDKFELEGQNSIARGEVTPRGYRRSGRTVVSSLHLEA